MEKISWLDRVKDEVLQKVKEERNILSTMKTRKANWIGNILRRNCLLKYISEGKIYWRTEVTGRRRRRSKQLLDDFKENERGSTRSHSVEHSLWQRMWNCRKADCGMGDGNAAVQLFSAFSMNDTVKRHFTMRFLQWILKRCALQTPLQSILNQVG
jgi:hypothetical protein